MPSLGAFQLYYLQIIFPTAAEAENFAKLHLTVRPLRRATKTSRHKDGLHTGPAVQALDRGLYRKLSAGTARGAARAPRPISQAPAPAPAVSGLGPELLAKC